MRRSLRKGRRRARRHLPRRRSRIRWGPVSALMVLAIVAMAAMLLEGRRGRKAVAGLVEYARNGQRSPTELVVAAARRNRVVFLGDVHPAAEPKRIAVEAIGALAHGPGLDAVVLEVDSDQQRFIDTYLASDPEDLSILLRNPRTLLEHWGVSHEYIEIYRRVWRLNQTLGLGRRIRIVAADLPGWPPSGPLPPQVAAARYAERDAFMEELIEREVLIGNPQARVLIFMGGYHGLKSGEAELHFGGGAPIPITWLGTRLNRTHPGEVFTIMVDGTVRSAAYGAVGSYASTRVYDVFRKHLPDARSSFALTVNDRFDFLREPIYETGGPGVSLLIRPDGYRLQDVVDGYIYLGPSPSLGVRR